MADIYFLMITAFSTIFSFIFFLLGLNEGIGNRNDFAKTIIYYITSFMFSLLCVGLYLSTEASFSIAFQFGFVFFAFMDFILVIFTAWKAYLFDIEHSESRYRRYKPDEDD